MIRGGKMHTSIFKIISAPCYPMYPFKSVSWFNGSLKIEVNITILTNNRKSNNTIHSKVCRTDSYVPIVQYSD